MPNNVARVKRYRDDVPLFSRFQIEHQIESAYSRQVNMPSGGAVVIDHTEALVAIDVNSGRATKGSDIEETALRTNLEAADEVARQLRLRDLGGLIVIDFIDMESAKNQREVESRLRDALHFDRARVQMGKISRFGLLELSRQRLRPALAETSYITCPRCTGTGHIRSTESAALHILRILEEEAMKENTGAIHAQVPVDVGTFLLNEKRVDIAHIELRHRINLVIIPNRQLETPQHEITRLRHDQLNSEEVALPSYQMAEKVTEEAYQPPSALAEVRTARQEAAVKGITPDQPAPVVQPKPQPKATAKEEPGIIAKIFSWFHGNKSVPEPQPEPKPAKPARRERGERGERGERSRGGRSRREHEGREGRAERQSQSREQGAERKERGESQRGQRRAETAEGTAPKENRRRSGKREERTGEPRATKAPRSPAPAAEAQAAEGDAAPTPNAGNGESGRRRGRRGRGRGERREEGAQDNSGDPRDKPVAAEATPVVEAPPASPSPEPVAQIQARRPMPWPVPMPMPEPVATAAVSAPEPLAALETPKPEPLVAPERPTSEPPAVPETPTPEPLAAAETPTPEPLVAPEMPEPEPVAVPETVTPEPLAVPEAPSPVATVVEEGVQPAPAIVEATAPPAAPIDLTADLAQAGLVLIETSAAKPMPVDVPKQPLGRKPKPVMSVADEPLQMVETRRD